MVLPASLSSGIARGSVPLEKSLRAMHRLLLPTLPIFSMDRTQGGDWSQTKGNRNSALSDHLDFLRKHTCLNEFNPQYYQSKTKQSHQITTIKKTCHNADSRGR